MSSISLSVSTESITFVMLIKLANYVDPKAWIMRFLGDADRRHGKVVRAIEGALKRIPCFLM